MSSALRELLTRPRSQYRVTAVALGIGFVAIGLAFGFEQQFSNWGVVATLVSAGALLVICGSLVPERYLAGFFAFCVTINVAAAAYALLNPQPGP
jgi:uncharacterized membrane protein YjjP (DUF1212 family)